MYILLLQNVRTYYIHYIALITDRAFGLWPNYARGVTLTLLLAPARIKAEQAAAPLLAAQFPPHVGSIFHRFQCMLLVV